jgi:VWFA-related protein
MPQKIHAFKRMIRAATVWLSVFVIAVPAVAQTPVPQTAAPQTPAPQATAAQMAAQTVVKVTTHLVQVNVVVQDKKGVPVADLTKDDFVVYDKGREQKIATFAMESSLPAGSAPARKIAPPPPNVFTNKVESRPDAPKSVTVILFDGLNTKFEDQAYAKQQIIKYLQQVGPEDRVALYALGLDLRVLHDFTSDTSELLAALAKHKGHYSQALTDANPDASETGNDDLDAWINQATQRMADFQQINIVNQTCEALEAIANHVAQIPGRKNLIWVSASFPFSIGFTDEAGADPTAFEQTFAEEMQRTARAMNEANMAIYPVDARGLIGISAFSATKKSGYNTKTGANAPRVSKSIYATQDTMNIMAEWTGGKAYYNSNDIKTAVSHAIDDGRVNYMLGFYPSDTVWDSSFHEIKVEVKRPHLNIRCRSGYYAYPDKAQSEDSFLQTYRKEKGAGKSEAEIEQLAREELKKKETDELNASFQDALWSPLEATNIGMTARVESIEMFSKKEPEKGSWPAIKVYLQLDPKDISLTFQDGFWVGGLQVLFVVQGKDGKVLSSLPNDVQMKLTQEKHDNIVKNGLTLAKVIEPGPDSDKIRVVTFDRTTGTFGSLNIPLSKVVKVVKK